MACSSPPPLSRSALLADCWVVSDCWWGGSSLVAMLFGSSREGFNCLDSGSCWVSLSCNCGAFHVTLHASQLCRCKRCECASACAVSVPLHALCVCV